MSLRLQTILAGCFALIAAALLALGPASANPASGGYQPFEPVALEHQPGIQLASLGNFATPPDNASECCNAPNRTQLIDDLVAGGTKITPENVIEIQKLPDGRTVWLETGTATGVRPAGLNHIIADHGADFANKGIAEADISDALFTALKDGKIVGYQGSGTGRPIYEYSYNGQIQYTAITVGDNGFIVGANPTSGP